MANPSAPTSGPGHPVDDGAGEPSRPDERVADGSPAVLQVVQEELEIGRRAVTTGTVRVSTHTDFITETAETILEHRHAEVTRIPVGRIVETAPLVRTEGAITIVPVLEERVVLVKQLVLVEELHIRQVFDHTVSQTPVTLRRQHAVVEHLDAEGAVMSPPTPGS